MEFGQTFWVALSFLGFIALVYKPVGKILCDALDARANKIQSELQEALKLKEEAQALLSSYQRKQQEVAKDAENIIIEAEAEAKRIAKESEAALDEALNKRVEVAMQKVAAYEASVLQQVKHNSVDIAISTVRQLINENLTKDMAQELVSKSVADLGRKLH